ncbi:MAG: AAA family ATPase [Patescibacteria group bacterium]|jgi:hypothetical protein
MGDKNGSCVPITAEQLKPFDVFAGKLIQSAGWQPKKPLTAPSADGGLKFSESMPMEERINWLELIKQYNPNGIINSANVNQLLNSLYTGIGIGCYVVEMYAKSSGLAKLLDDNSRQRLNEGQKAEFSKKLATAAAVAQFSFASFVSWSLSRYQGEKLDSLSMDFPGYPEICLTDYLRGFNCLLVYMGKFVKESGKIRTDLDLLKAVQVAAQGALDEIKLRRDSLEYTQFFTDVAYKLEGEDFTISGFENRLNNGTIGVEFKRVDIKTIVGNRDAKRFFQRLAVRAACYKVAERRNVMYDLGGMPAASIGFGIPGTGKTMMIGAFSTMLYDLCKWLELPYVFDPHPPNIVSTYQGGSRERAEEWWQRILNPNRISFGPADDAEVNYEDRTRPGVSAGVREVIGAALTNLEGASAIWRGNAVVFFLTNIPDQLDPALLSRIVTRFKIDGATTWQDFLDQDHLWWKRIAEIDPAFIAMADPDDYEYLFAQRLIGSMAETYIGYQQPRERVILDIFNRVNKERDIKEQKFFAQLYQEIQKQFPKFSSRDVRNIQRAVDDRLLDFDFPEAWMSDPEIFFRQPYDRQKIMVLELMRENMQGKSFAEIRFQEAMRYLDNMVAIVDLGHRREVERASEQMMIQAEASRAIQSRLEPRK